jgi:hypothetical protein
VALTRDRYMIDTCSFTTLRREYPSDVFGPVWEHLSSLIKGGQLVSCEDVYIELIQQDDLLAKWIKEHKSMFLPLDEDTQDAAKMILSRFRTLVDLKKKKSSADVFLIASAMREGCVVVTEENRSGGPPKVKIPDVCDGLGVRCIKLLDLFRESGFKLERAKG